MELLILAVHSNAQLRGSTGGAHLVGALGAAHSVVGALGGSTW